ncbi:MAG: DUF979 family protein [Novosphingobium sp.]|nr:DUF979 family protein [Novosphingobium sp.]
MIGLELVYALAGAMFLGFALVTALYRRDRKGRATALLWGLIALSFLLGDTIGDMANGVLAIVIVVVAASGRTGAAPASNEGGQEAAASRYGNRLFLPALAIPAIALAGTVLFKSVPGIVKASDATLVSLGLGALASTVICMVWFRTRAEAPLREGVRLADGLGWAILMPQLLASLGIIYAAAGMGTAVGSLLDHVDTGGSLFAQVALYCMGMALLTVLMGNALAAFPVMFAAMGAPLLVTVQHGDPAAVAAIGMLAGFCGTLLTPMAANFNLVPAALLNLRDPYGVIRAQAPTALAMLAANILLLYFLGFSR